MKVEGVPYRTIWVEADGRSVGIIDQTKLPHLFETIRLRTVEEAAAAIREMRVRGAPLIGATGAYGLCLAVAQDAREENLDLRDARPTAVNLRWALDEMRKTLAPLALPDRAAAA